MISFEELKAAAEQCRKAQKNWERKAYPETINAKRKAEAELDRVLRAIEVQEKQMLNNFDNLFGNV